ncbi:MAG: Uma2 family endonuclease [Planctomycetota bacterium]
MEFVWEALKAWLNGWDNGRAFFAPLPLQVSETRAREPDVMFVFRQNSHQRDGRYWSAADFVVEVVSENDPNCDFVAKARNYAIAGVPEYWIIDPRDRSVTRLHSPGDGSYAAKAVIGIGQTIKSMTLDGFQISVDALLA